MKSLVGKLNFFSATICLLAALFAVVAVSSIHRVSDESKTEIVEFDFEECEAIAHRQKRREPRPHQPSLARVPSKLLEPRLQRSELRFYRPKTERSYLNGCGSYLRT